MKHHLFRTVLLVALSCAGTVHAVTLGQPRVMSFLGQPLEVQIGLTGLEPDQQRDLNLRIANDWHFERLGILYTEFLDALTFDVAGSDGQWIVRVRTKQPVVEPYLDFPLQVSWPGGQLIKQYTLLLEPPARARSKRRATHAVAHPPAPKYGNNYGPVRRGEILTAVAQKLKPGGITTWQMSIVLFRANPHAFTDGNINKLRVGSVLSIPGLDVIGKLDNPSAIAAFATETTRWQARMATTLKTAVTSRSDMSGMRANSGVTAEKQRRSRALAGWTAAEESPDEAARPVVANEEETDAHHDDQQSMYEQLLLTMEDIETHRITNDSVEARLERMEAQLADMRELLALKHLRRVAIQAEAAAGHAIQATSKKAEPPLTGNMWPTTHPWYEGYLWGGWIALALTGLSTILVMRRRSSRLTEDGYVLALPDARRNGASSRPEIEQTPPAAQVAKTEGDRDRPREHPAGEPISAVRADCPEPAEPDITANGTAEERIPSVDEIAPRYDMTDLEDGPHSEPGLQAECLSDIGEVELAYWAAELDEDFEVGEEQSAHKDTTEGLNDRPDLSDDPLIQPDAGVDGSLNDHIDPVSDIGEDGDFSLSIDLARAYLEIGDQEGAEEILKRALAGAPDPGSRHQMEELLIKIG